MKRKVRIVATLGPASQTPADLERLILAGVNVARLNFSHGAHSDHAARVAAIRRTAERLGVSVAVLQDLQGPKIRLGKLEQAGARLEPDARVTLYAEGDDPPGEVRLSLPVDFPELFAAAQPGSRVLLDDGRLALTVESVSARALTARVVVGGLVTSNKGINLPGVSLPIPSFTEKDEADLAFGLSQGMDAVAVSFVRSAADVRGVRAALRRLAPEGPWPLLVAKLEKPEALDDLDAILEAADGVMVARGDLGVEMSPECVPTAQKRIIRAANLKGKLVITATQMLDSMMHNALPTRAEASDVANAVFDGTDAVMLSGETAAGKYPLESVEMMHRIVCEAEANYDTWGHDENLDYAGHDDALSLALAARTVAHDRDVAAIAVFTVTGRSAWIMSKTRPGVPVLALTPEVRTYRRLALFWGVTPHKAPFSRSLEEMIASVERAVRETGVAQPGQQVVVVSGFPVGAARPPTLALLHTVGV